MSTARPVGWKRQAIAILLFGAAFGYVEAAVVTYLRPQFDVLQARFYPQRSPGELFPMLSAQQVKAAGPEMVRLAATEVIRESATLIMLGAAAAAVGGNLGQWFALFLMAFGAWDLSYYAFLKILIDWPKSLLTWDILFLLPVPWSGPVLAPALVSLTMVGAGLVYVWRESNGRPMRLRAVHWLGVYAAGLIIVAAFTWDYRSVMAGAVPKGFHWAFFAVGEVLGVTGFLHALHARDP